MDFIEGYMQGRMLRELEDANARADRNYHEIIDKYNALVKRYKEDTALLEADRDAAYAVVGEFRDRLGVSKEETQILLDKKYEQFLASQE